MSYLNVELRSSPHIWRGVSVESVMLQVVYALVPIVTVSVYFFGLSALLLIIVTTLSCLFSEWIFCKLSHKASTISDCSAIVTGLTLALSLPPALPLWLGSLGGVVAMFLGKLIFGGLGYNPFNPALVGRAFLQAAFPVAISTWTPPLMSDRFFKVIPSTFNIPFTDITLWTPLNGTAIIAGATPLSVYKYTQELTESLDLILGNVLGSVGETSSIVIFTAGIYLVFKRIVNWRIPAGILGVTFLLSLLLHSFTLKCPEATFMLLSGGLFFGAFFMASDMVTSPVTKLGMWIYAAFIGMCVVLIRTFGSLPEGMMYAILLGNAFTPLINRFTQPSVFGHRS